MTASSNQSVAHVLFGRPLFFAVLLCVVVGGVICECIHRRSVPPTLPVEAHRSNLEFRGGRWFVPGETNGLTGLLYDTYDNGAVKSRSAVSNGWLHGLSQGWHTNGQQQVEEHFQAGVSHGARTKWYEDGTKLSEAMIVNGKLHGPFRRWHENGTMAEAVEMKAGEPDGVSWSYYPSGFLKAEVRLRAGQVLEKEFWKDGEFRAAADRMNGPGGS